MQFLYSCDISLCTEMNERIALCPVERVGGARMWRPKIDAKIATRSQ